MRPEFTNTGIQVQTFQEIYDELADGYRDIYGEDINLDPDSPARRAPGRQCGLGFLPARRAQR